MTAAGLHAGVASGMPASGQITLSAAAVHILESARAADHCCKVWPTFDWSLINVVLFSLFLKKVLIRVFRYALRRRLWPCAPSHMVFITVSFALFLVLIQ